MANNEEISSILGKCLPKMRGWEYDEIQDLPPEFASMGSQDLHEREFGWNAVKFIVKKD